MGQEEARRPSDEDEGSKAASEPFVSQADPHSPDRGRETLCILKLAGSDSLS